MDFVGEVVSARGVPVVPVGPLAAAATGDGLVGGGVAVVAVEDAGTVVVGGHDETREEVMSGIWP